MAKIKNQLTLRNLVGAQREEEWAALVAKDATMPELTLMYRGQLRVGGNSEALLARLKLVLEVEDSIHAAARDQQRRAAASARASERAIERRARQEALRVAAQAREDERNAQAAAGGLGPRAQRSRRVFDPFVAAAEPQLQHGRRKRQRRS